MHKKTIILCIAILFSIMTLGCTINKSESDYKIDSRMKDKQVIQKEDIAHKVIIEEDEISLQGVGERVFENYLEQYKDKKIPESRRIKDYKIINIEIKNISDTENTFAIEFLVLPASDEYVLNENGVKNRNGWIAYKYPSVVVKNNDNVCSITHIDIE